MEAINTSLPPAPAPELPKAQPAAAVSVSVPQVEKDNSVEVTLSEKAQQTQLEEQKREAKQATEKFFGKQKEQADVPPPPPPPPPKQETFFEANQKAEAERKVAEQQEAKNIARRTADSLNYTVDYLAKVAYAKTLADQPINPPRTPQPQDIVDRLDLFT